MSKRRSTLLGLTLGGAVAVMLPVLLGASAGREDLVVNVEGARGFEILPSPDSARIGALAIPASVGAQHLLLRGRGGLDLTTWSKTYGGAYLREVTWPSLVGPFQNEADYVCGYSLYLGAGLFDTSAAGRGLRRVVEERLRRSLPSAIEVPEYDISVPMPALAKADVAIRLGVGGAIFSFSVYFEDSSTFSVTVPVRLVSENGAPVVRRSGRVSPPVLVGPLRERLMEAARSKGADTGAWEGCLLAGLFTPFGLGCIPGAMIGADQGSAEGERQATAMLPGKAEKLASDKIDEVLNELALGLRKLRDPWHPTPSRPDDEIRLKLDADPIVTSTGITVPLCVRATASEPKIDATIPGAVSFGSERLLHGDSGSTDPVLGLAMNADAVNQVVYYLWQSGLLRQVGESSLVLDALTREVRMAAFDFAGLDPGLPPTLMPSAAASGSGLPFVLGNVKLGAMGPRTVMGHGQAVLSVVQEGDSILLQGAVDDVRINCIEPVVEGTKFTPCLADLLPVVRSVAQEAEKRPSYRFSGADVLGKLPQLGFQGMRLGLSKLRVNTEGNPVRIDLSVHAQIN